MQQVTITEAAKHWGVSPATVKRRLQRGEITGHQEARPQGFRWVVEVDTDQTNHQVTTHPSDGGSDGHSTTTDPTALIAILQDRVHAQTEELTARRREISELHQLLAQQTALNAGRHPWWKFW